MAKNTSSNGKRELWLDVLIASFCFILLILYHAVIEPYVLSTPMFIAVGIIFKGLLVWVVVSRIGKHAAPTLTSLQKRLGRIPIPTRFLPNRVWLGVVIILLMLLPACYGFYTAEKKVIEFVSRVRAGKRMELSLWQEIKSFSKEARKLREKAQEQRKKLIDLRKNNNR
jgi:hypothetical protein